MNLKRYYEQCDLYLPDNARWRIFKFIKENKCLRLYIRDRQELRKKLLEYLPDSVYYSTSCFLNPKKVKGIMDPFVSHRNLLYSDMALDFDSHNCSIYHARYSAEIAINIIEKEFQNFKRKYILFSGGGFHVVYKHMIPEIANPKEREKFIRKEREKVIKRLNKSAIFDEEITRDLNRVIRLPFTINVKRGQIAKIISKNSLSHFIIPKTLEIENDKNRLGSVHDDEISSHWNLQKDEGEEGFGDNFYPLLSNEIFGMNRWCLFLIYYRSLYFVKRDIRRLQRIYNLPDVYIFKRAKNLYYAICLQTFQKRRINKIVKASRADKTQLKFNRTWLRMPFYHTTTLENGKEHIYISKQHHNLLRQIFPNIKEYPNKHGEKIPIISAHISPNLS